MKRREFVAAAGALTTLAGCTSVSPSQGGDCDRHDIVDVVETGRVGGFTVSVNPESVPLGESVTVRMENATETDQYTGNRHKFTIHEQTGSGWQSVYGVSDGGWNDIGIEHGPGEGFTWEIVASQSGFSNAPNGLDACSLVDPGTYRFVYWGLSTDEEEASDWEQEYGLGATFSVTE